MLTKFKLFERKQVGLLYHWTYLDALEKILKTDKMWSAMNYISFSRNKNLNFHDRPVKITFDGDKMSDEFKFEPHLYMKDVNYKEESEERIECDEYSETKETGWEDMISGVKKYIIDIEVSFGEFIFEKDYDIEKEFKKLQRLSPVKIKTDIEDIKRAGLLNSKKPEYQFLKDPTLASLFKESIYRDIITSYKLFESTQTQKFEIPEQIRKYYVIEGDMSNSKNWKSTKYFSPFVLGDENKESGLGIRYVLISLDSNHIIPINMNDEHRIGYEVLYDVFYDKYKVPHEKYVSICTWGNHYVWNLSQEKKEQVGAIKKYLDYGGNPDLIIHVRTGNSDVQYDIPASGFVEFEGNLEEFKKKILNEDKISPKGEKLISILSRLSELWRDYMFNETEEENIIKQTKFKWNIEKEIVPAADSLYSFIIMNDREYPILKDLYDKFAKKLKTAIDDFNVDKIGDIVFTHNGLKNDIHIQLKQPNNKKMKDFFWNVKKARTEFDRLSSM